MDLLKYSIVNLTDASEEVESVGVATHNFSSLSCRYSILVMDFLSKETINETYVEEEWPCAVREYWVNMRGFVTFVRFLFNYISVLVVISGLMLNTVAFLTLSSASLASNSLSVYLRALALSDNGVLIFSTSANLLRKHCDSFNSLVLENRWLCDCYRITAGLFFQYSAWLVVALTFERLLMIRWPMQSRSIWGIRPAIFITTVLGIIVLFMNILRLKNQGFEQDNVYEYASCSTAGRPEVWSNSTYFTISISTWVPTFLIVVGNACIVYHLHKSANQRSKLSETKFSPGPDTQKLTRLLIIVSTVYVILLLPVGIVSSIDLYWRVHKPSVNGRFSLEYIEWKKRSLLLKWLRGLFFFVYSCNFAINFFVYCISGNNFRHAVKVVTDQWLSSFCYKYVCEIKKHIHPETPQTKTSCNKNEDKWRQRISTSTSSTLTLVSNEAEPQNINTALGNQDQMCIISENKPCEDKQLTIITE